MLRIGGNSQYVCHLLRSLSITTLTVSWAVAAPAAAGADCAVRTGNDVTRQLPGADLCITGVISEAEALNTAAQASIAMAVVCIFVFFIMFLKFSGVE